MAMQDMVKCLGTEDVFFDSIDHLAENDYTIDGVLGYECWMNEPRSIKERRETFLCEMGFVEPRSSSEGNKSDDDDEQSFSIESNCDNDMLERTIERNGDVSSSCSSSSNDSDEENVVFYDEHQIRQNLIVGEDDELSTSSDDHKSINKKIRHWWKEMIKKQRGSIGGCKCKDDDDKHKSFEMSRMKVQANRKKFRELSELFASQEFQAHKGLIWTMKFSPDGQYLATGGEDGVVRVWRVKSVDSSLESLPDELASPKKDENTGFLREEKVKMPVIIPDKIFKIEEMPIQEFHGHDADVLDLSWSKSNLILSSSMDKTVRLWQVGSNSCMGTFHHTDYVTCVQFNPVDNCSFISGSIDEKVRVWGVSKQRVLDWADIGDAVTAVCYQPDGKAFVAGSLSGSCLFYETKGDLFELSAHIGFHSSRRSSTNRITGIQFSPEDSTRVMVMSEDSKLRILDKTRVVRKFRGLPKSGSQMSASYTANGGHILSIGQDSHVYLWNHDKSVEIPSGHVRSNRSCEFFFSEGVTVALPWYSPETKTKISNSWTTTEHEVVSSARDPPTFSLSSFFLSKQSATWPEEMLPVLTQHKDQSLGRNTVAHSSTWGLVIVTANCDGMIKTYQNYGLPSRV